MKANVFISFFCFQLFSFSAFLIIFSSARTGPRFRELNRGASDPNRREPNYLPSLLDCSLIPSAGLIRALRRSNWQDFQMKLCSFILSEHAAKMKVGFFRPDLSD
jgi:hypothetical protein